MTASTHTNRLQVGGVTLQPETISLDLDEERIPYAILRATVPLDDATIDTLDPRTSPPPRVNVGMSQAFGYGQTLADLDASFAPLLDPDIGFPRVNLRDLSMGTDDVNPNSGFETGLQGWAATSIDTTIAVSSTEFASGLQSMEITATVSPATVLCDAFPMEMLGRLFVQVFVNVASGVTNATFRQYLYDANGVFLQQRGVQVNDPTPGLWYRLRLETSVTPGVNDLARFCRLEARLTGTNPHAYVDDFTFRYGRPNLASLTAQYGTPFNPGGWRPSTRVRGKLYLADRQVDHATGTVQITANSDDGRLNEYALTSRTAMTPGGSTVRDCCNMVLGHVLNTALPAGSTGSEIVETDALAWQPGELAWSYLGSIIGMAGLRLWCDERGLWHLEDPELVEVRGQYVASPDILADLTDAVSRENGGWGDGAVVTFEWTDSNGDRRTRYDAAGLQGGRTITRTVERAYPGTGAARGMLRKAQALGRVLGLGGVADYSVRPYQAAQATLPDGSLHAGAVAAVTWSQPNDVMTVRTRDLLGITENSYLYTPSGVAYDDVPAGVSYAAYLWEG
ncbi:hypothetical protein [Jiangella muralis]|uniref:hypothetical protein n=1 Tax=Jiangella muralis TaxID=702383 RepID=UPI00069F138C|nr:hypothetical protein [Jiangella muralis]